MNVEQLLDIIDRIRRLEKKYKLQARLKEAQQAFDLLVASPQDAAIQTDWVNKLQVLSTSLDAGYAELTPTDLNNISTLGGEYYFSPEIVTEIREIVQNNAITPTVAKKHIDTLVTDRETLLAKLTQIASDLKEVGFEPDTLSPGDVEIGFLLPRSLFHDNLKELAKELSVIDRVIRFVGEAIGSDNRDVTVRSISTTDPLFFFGYDVQTVVTIGGLVSWCLFTLKKVLEIEELRRKLQSVGLPEKETEALDKRMANIIDSSIDEKVTSILKERAGPRSNELRSGVDWAIRSLMSRVERGMMVEVRFLPPPAPADGDDTGVDQAAVFEKLAEVVRELEFPNAVTDTPIVAIPPPTPPGEKRDGKAMEPDNSKKAPVPRKRAAKPPEDTK